LRDHDFGGPTVRSRRRRFDDEPVKLKRRGPQRRLPDPDAGDGPPAGDRWSTWDAAAKGPEPWPDWIITDHAAVDTDLGVLKTGKEADVHLVERSVPGTDRRVLLAAKRYRAPEHRLFHRDAGYLEGRRVKESRVTRAMSNRTSFGRDVIAGEWAAAEFDALNRLWRIGREHGGVRVPYPVQVDGTELMLEFLGDADGQAAPRLVQTRPTRAQVTAWWGQLVDALTVLARAGLAHGDLSPYNVLVHDDNLVLIDLPQVVDIVINPQGPEFLARDVRNVAGWFASRGHPVDADGLVADLLIDANYR